MCVCLVNQLIIFVYIPNVWSPVSARKRLIEKVAKANEPNPTQHINAHTLSLSKCFRVLWRTRVSIKLGEQVKVGNRDFSHHKYLHNFRWVIKRKKIKVWRGRSGCWAHSSGTVQLSSPIYWGWCDAAAQPCQAARRVLGYRTLTGKSLALYINT